MDEKKTDEKSIDSKIAPLTQLQLNRKAKVMRLDGGHGFQGKLRVLGIREGQVIEVVSKQPLSGPITVAVKGSQVTLGRGMSQKIIVEKL